MDENMRPRTNVHRIAGTYGVTIDLVAHPEYAFVIDSIIEKQKELLDEGVALVDGYLPSLNGNARITTMKLTENGTNYALIKIADFIYKTIPDARENDMNFTSISRRRGVHKADIFVEDGLAVIAHTSQGVTVPVNNLFSNPEALPGMHVGDDEIFGPRSGPSSRKTTYDNARRHAGIRETTETARTRDSQSLDDLLKH